MNDDHAGSARVPTGRAGSRARDQGRGSGRAGDRAADQGRARARARDHGVAALTGLALGDALGMPTQSMSREVIRADHGSITGFVDAGPHQRIAAGMSAGSVTDDTEQALLLADLLIEGDGRVDPAAFAERLIVWERDMEARGSLDLLGPSTKRAVTAILEGVPVDEAGRFGTTNGAAMRIAPVGIACPSGDVRAIVDAVEDASRVTHHTGLGIAGAAAIAAAVSAGLDGASPTEALDLAVAAARLGATRGHWIAGADIGERLTWARDHLPRVPVDDRVDVVSSLIGTSVASQESVVAALALVALGDDPWRSLGVAASVGGDTDTIAAMAGAVLGALHGMSAWPGHAVETVTRVNHLALEPIVERLVLIREARA